MAYGSGQVIYEAVKNLGGNIPNQEALSNAILDAKITSSPRGPFRFDRATNNVIQNIYIREARKEGGEIHNYVIATYKETWRPRRIGLAETMPIKKLCNAVPDRMEFLPC